MDEELPSPVTDYYHGGHTTNALKASPPTLIYTQTRLTFMRHMSIIRASTQNHYLFTRAKNVERCQGRMSFYFLDKH